MKFAGKVLLHTVTAAALVFVGELFWPNMGSRSPTAMIISSALLSFGLYRLMKYRHMKTRRQHFQIWLEFISARLVAGSTLEDAIIKSPDAVGEMISHRAELTVALRHLQTRLENRVELSLALNQFKADFPLQDMGYIIDLLPYLRERGGRIDAFVRKSHRSLTAAIYTENEVRSEQSGQSSEAAVLCVLPFLFSWAMTALGNPVLRTEPAPKEHYTVIYAVLFMLAWFAVTAVLLIHHLPDRKLKNMQRQAQSNRQPGNLTRSVASVFRRYMPAQVGFTLARNANQLYIDTEDGFLYHVHQQLRLFASIFTCSVIPTVILKNLWFLSIPFIVWVIRDFAVISKVREINAARESGYPAFINALTILLQSGLTVESGIRMLRHTELSDPILTSDLDHVLREADSGIPISACLTRWANTMPPNEINSAIMLIARYETDGSRETLELVMLHAENSWRLYRQAQRRRLQRRSMLYLFPMGIDLIVIMALSILPSLVVFQM